MVYSPQAKRLRLQASQEPCQLELWPSYDMNVVARGDDPGMVFASGAILPDISDPESNQPS